jgi:hypothetical protein
MFHYIELWPKITSVTLFVTIFLFSNYILSDEPFLYVIANIWEKAGEGFNH